MSDRFRVLVEPDPDGGYVVRIVNTTGEPPTDTELAEIDEAIRAGLREIRDGERGKAMRFSATQYQSAIDALKEGMRQLEGDENCCAICEDSGHWAFECGHNPLVAMALCDQIARNSEQLHETLHYLAGWDFAFGVQLGPRAVVVPENGEGVET